MTSVPMPVPGSRRRILKGALGLAAASFAAPSFANVVQPHRLRLWMEGDIDLAWVHSLFVPPELAAGLPPGLVARLRVECPATAGRAARERATTVLYVFAAPAGVAPGVPAPEAFPISRLHMVAESVLLSVAEFSDPDTRPAKNLVISGTCIANDITSPFGSIVGRIAYLACGFEWPSAASDDATFKLVTVGAAGSHVTVAPHAAGEIAFV